MRVIEKTLYKYEELSDEAKGKARDWYRSRQDCHDLDCVIEDAATIADILGIDLRTRPVKLMNGSTRYDPCIWYSVSDSQGDGASFEGTYRYKKGAVKAIKDYCNDVELIRIAEGLQDVQRRYFYRLTASMGQGTGSNFYSHSGTMSVSVDYAEDSSRSILEAEEEVTQLMRGFADWIYGRLREEVDYQSSDEYVEEAIICNEYEFDEEGRIV